MKGNVLKRLSDIRVFVFDVDGVFTDGNLLLLDDGSLLRSVHVKDGFAVKQAIKHLYKVVIISGMHSDGVVERFRSLGVKHIFTNVEDKLTVLEQFILDHGFDKSSVLYMGDDIPDKEVLQGVGIPTCPYDAVPEVTEICDYQSTKAGGKGCVREVIEMVLKVQGNWV